MTNYRSAQGMSADESTYNALVTTSDWHPLLGTASMKNAPVNVDAESIMPGTGLLADNRYRTAEGGAGQLPYEVLSKTMGKLFRWAMGGNSTHTLVSGTTFQSVHSFGTGALPSRSVQLVRELVTGTEMIDTFGGVTATGFEISMDKTGLLKVTIDTDFASYSTVVAKATPTVSYPRRFGWKGFTAMTGTRTAATTTALASCTTTLDGLRSFSVKATVATDTEDYRGNGLGIKSQPYAQLRDVQFTGEFDFLSSTLRDNHRTLTAFPILLQFVTPTALSTGFETFQIDMPTVLVKEDPEPNMDGTLPTISVTGDVMISSTNSTQLQLVQRTSDTTL